MENNATTSSQVIAGFQTLQILNNKFTVTTNGKKHSFDTPKDEINRIKFVNCNHKDRPITYGVNSSQKSLYLAMNQETGKLQMNSVTQKLVQLYTT